MDIVNSQIAKQSHIALKLLFGVLWLFVGDEIVKTWAGDNADTLYWFLTGGVIAIVMHAIYSFGFELLKIFELITVEKDLYEKLSEEVFETNGIALAIKNIKGKYIYANEEFCESYGVTKAYIIGKSDESFMDELEVMKSTQEEMKLVETEQLIKNTVTLSINDKDKHIQVTKCPLYNNKNQFKAIAIVRKDITKEVEIKKHNEYLKDRYNRLFDDLPFPTLLLDISTTLATEFNDALLNMLGYQRGEFYRTRLGLYLEDEHDETLEFISQIVKEDGGIRDIKLISKDKVRYDVEAHFKVVYEGEKKYLHIILRDVTENKQATDALVQSEQNYRTLFNHANDAIFIIDSQTLAIFDANELAYIWLGYDDGELNSLSIFDVDKAGLEKVTREKLNELSHHKDVLFEHEMCTYEGDTVPVEISAHTVIYGNKLAYQYVVRDISERKVAEWALKESEERYWQMFENNSSIMLVLDPIRWTIEDANEAAIQFYKISREDLVGSLYSRINIGNRKKAAGVNDPIIKKEVYECTHKLGNSDIRFVEINEAPIEIHGRQLCFSIIRDITDSKEVVSQLNLAQRMFASSSESVLVLDNNKMITSVNNALLSQAGYTEKELLGQRPEIIFANLDSLVITDEVEDILSKNNIWKSPAWCRKKSGESYFVNLHIELIKDEAGKIIKYVFMMSSEVHESAASGEAELMHKSLIGLPDKKHFIERLNYALKKSRRSGKYIAVVLVDIRRFNEINKRDGFDVGDKLLQSIGSRMRFMTRESDYVSNFGADKFAMLLEDIAEMMMVNTVAQKVLSTLAESYHVDNEIYDLTFAIGISLFPEDGDDALDLLSKAESALQSAKLEDKNRYQLFSSELNDKGKRWWDSELRLHEALKNDEFKCYFLPQFNLKTNKLAAVEVLLRWDHPTKGLLSPGELLVEAENTGFIVAIGDWVIRNACQFMKELKDKKFKVPEIVINISISQLDESFREFLAETVSNAGLKLNHIALDVNESAMLNMTHEQHLVVKKLRADGVKFQIDNFGKGATSLSVLLDIEFDRVKMDARLINQLVKSEKVQKHCQMVKAMSDVLGFKIIAEGVEEQEQIKVLKQMKCHYSQGYYYSEVLDFTELMRYIEKL